MMTSRSGDLSARVFLKHKSKMAGKDGGNNKAVSHVGSTKTLLCACSRVHSSVSVACDCCVFKFLRRSVDGKRFHPFCSVHKKHLMRFQSETFVFKYLRRSVDGA